MPKVTSRRTSIGHSPSAKISQRFAGNAFTAQPDIVDIGSMVNASAAEIFSAVKASAPMPAQVKKKEKQQTKQRAFLERLQSSQHPYSRSHNRRLKRKEKQQLVAKMDDLNTALDCLESGPLEAPKNIPGVTSARRGNGRISPNAAQGARQIGEGKGATLSATQRKNVLKTEKARLSLVQATKEYVENPFELIRKHAQATLEPPPGLMTPSHSFGTNPS